MPAYTLLSLFGREFALAHILGKEPRHLRHGDHMKLQHQFDAFHGSLTVFIEEENTGVIDEHIHHQFILDAEIM